MVALPVDIIGDFAYSYLETRSPKGGGRGGGSGKSSGSKVKGGGGGGSGEPLPQWAVITICAVIIWTIFLLCLWYSLYVREVRKNPEKPHKAARSFGKALMFMLFITPFVWAFKKIRNHFLRGKGTYSKVEEDRAKLVRNSHEEAAWSANTEYGKDRESGYEPYGGAAGNLNTASPYSPPSPQPGMAPSPMTSRDPSPTPQPPPYSAGGVADSFYTPPPVPPPTAAQYYDPLSR